MKSKKAVVFAVGGAVAASLAGLPIASAGDNPFGLQSLKSGYQVADADKKADGKCGEGKCGANKTGATKTGGDGAKADAESTKTAEGDKKADGKCGEGKCGANKK